MTIGEQLQMALVSAAGRHGNDEMEPSVLLWTDPARLWQPVIHRLRATLPDLLCLGSYAPQEFTGPAIWLRCMVGGVLDWKATRIPIIYMPGISRSQLRSTQDAIQELQPLIALQYSGAIWFHPNGKDWTPTAFISSLNIEIATDEATRSAIHERLLKLFDTEPEMLISLGRIDSHKIRNLETDWPAVILAWMEQPTQRPTEWVTFCQICRSQYQLDPEKDPEIHVAELLAEAEKSWKSVWDRYAHALNRYPNITRLLGTLRPKNLLIREEGYPYLNGHKEQELHGILERLPAKPVDEVRTELISLDANHGYRRGWVWAELGQSPLAISLQHLVFVAQGTSRVPEGASLESFITSYVNGAWQTDLEALRAYSTVNSQEAPLIGRLLAAIYGPWLEQSAKTFAMLAAHTKPRSLWKPEPMPQPGECILFADGLRFDTGQLLLMELEKYEVTLSASHRIVGLPAVTPTAKPAVSPVSNEMTGSEAGTDFCPLVATSGQEVHIKQLHDLLTSAGIQILKGTDVGDTTGMAWTEIGTLDHAGHENGAILANRIDDEIRRIQERITGLIDAGWRTVRVVTDHGWLWLPGGLPKTALPAYLTETRWGRCAAIKAGSVINLPTVEWHFNSSVEIAVPTGISCFKGGLEYAHGGLSLQECVIPVITVNRNMPVAQTTIESIKWVGLRCRIETSGASRLYADIRTRLNDPVTSVVDEVKVVKENGEVSLMCDDDRYENTAAHVVIYNESGNILTKMNTTIGGDQ